MMTSKDELAVDGFAKGDSYNAARPRYPDEVIDHFVRAFDLDARSNVLDLGAGTGIFTRQLVSRVGRITAVDPSPSMRATFALETPGVEILEGSDEAIPLADHSVDAVFAAQAFHWFTPELALREIHRVLMVGGGLGLVWNERDTRESWIRDLNHAMLWDVHQPYDADVDFGAIVATGPFRDVVKSTFPYASTLTHDQVLQRTLTTSYITLMDEDRRRELSADVLRVLEPLPDPVEMPYVTHAFVAYAREDDDKS